MYYPVCHPEYKTNYWRERGWEEDWIKTAIQIFRETWKNHYKPRVTEECTEEIASETDNDDALEAIFARQQPSRSKEDAAEVWLREPTFRCQDPLKLLNAKLDERNVDGQPQKITQDGAFARMCLDFLSAPGIY